MTAERQAYRSGRNGLLIGPIASFVGVIAMALAGGSWLAVLGVFLILGPLATLLFVLIANTSLIRKNAIEDMAVESWNKESRL